MVTDELHDSLQSLRADLESAVDVAPFELVRRRHSHRVRRQAAGAGFALAAVLAVAIGVAPMLGQRASQHVGQHGPEVGAVGAGHPRPTVTVTVTAQPSPGDSGSAPSQSTRSPLQPAAPGGLTLSDVSFGTAHDGVALGHRCGSGQRCALVVDVSDDGGSTFATERLVDSGGGPDATKIAYRGDGRTVYAYDPGLYVSHDGGASWSDMAPDGPSVADIATNGSLATVLVRPSGSGPAQVLSGPYVANSLGEFGGPNPVPNSDRSARLQAPPGGSLIVTVGALDDGQQTPGVEIYTNGSWRQHPLPEGCNGPSLATVGSRALWLVCAQRPIGGQQSSTAYRSTDGGAHWVETAALPPSGSSTTVTALSADTAYLSGGADLFATHDGGASWAVELADAGGGGFTEPHIADFGGSRQSWVVQRGTHARVWLGVGSGWQPTVLQ